MFTGLVSDIGRVRAVEDRPGGRRLVIEIDQGDEDMREGASIACAGACLTVVAHGPRWFAADVSAETLACTTLGGWSPGRRVNLEQPLRLGDPLGGHWVQGHVDGVGHLESVEPVGESVRLRITAPDALARFIARKGSIAVDGVSLTINTVTIHGGEANCFAVNIVPHTWRHTTLPDLAPGESVNIEVDILARYAARLMERPEG